MKADPITVVLATDNGYLLPTYIALFSLLQNHRDPRRLEVYVFVPEGYSDEHRQVLGALVNGWGNARLSFVDAGDAFSSVKMGLSHVSTTSMYRLMAPTVLATCDKCVYLDSDLVVEGDVAELFDVDMDGFCVAGVRERTDWPKRDDWRDILGIPSLDGYVNAGVLVMNLREIRESGLAQELAEKGLTEGFVYNDQDVINVVFYGRIRHLPLRCNAMWDIVEYDPEELQSEVVSLHGVDGVEESLVNPLVVHYAGTYKPWQHPSNPRAGHWWRYVKLLDAQTRARVAKPFLRANGGTPQVRLSEAGKTMLRRLGLYGLIRTVARRLRGKASDRSKAL